MRFQYLIEGVAVAHAPLGEQKLLLGQLLQRDGVLCRQRVPGGATKQMDSGISSARTMLGCTSGSSSV